MCMATVYILLPYCFMVLLLVIALCLPSFGIPGMDAV